MQPLAGSLLANMGRKAGHVRRHFGILLWIVDSLGGGGGGFKSIFFLGDDGGFEKLGRNGFLSHSPTYLV